jgi:hypothetical protein
MDTELLVDNEIDEGKRLVDQLARDGFEVTVAFWVTTSDEGRSHLYIASPSIEAGKVGEAYRRVYASLSRIPGAVNWSSAIKLINDKNPIARAAADARDRFPAKLPIRFQGQRLGDLPVREAYIYSPVDPEKIWLRQAFSVTYVRQAGTNTWRATTTRRELYRGIKTKGAVSYASASYEGEKPEDQKFAIVSVLVEIDPKLDEEAILDDPAIRHITADQARKLADDWFKSRHPDSTIEHNAQDD